MITKLNDLTDYDINSGVVENTSIFKANGKSLELSQNDYISKDLTRFSNETFTTYFRTNQSNNFKFQYLLGCDNLGTGQALRIDGTATTLHFRIVNITTYGNPSYDSVIFEKDFFNILNINDDLWYKITIIISNNKLRVLFDGIILIDIINFTPTDNYYGYSAINSTTLTYISDINYYIDQIFYGNINLNGTPDDNGKILMASQDTMSIQYIENSDINGNWMIFNDGNPINFNKYVLIGYLNDKSSLQPRGIGNITL